MTNVPQDLVYTDLMVSQVEPLKQSFGKAAAEQNSTADFSQTTQPNGLVTLTIHFKSKPVPVVPAAQPAQVHGATPETAAAPAAAALALPPINFATGGRALAQAEFDQAVVDLGAPEPQLLWALIKKESETLTGYLGDRRPVILYERHVFSRQSGHRFDASHSDISGPPYGKGGYGTLPQQYDRLSRAMTLDRIAALKACSWGLGQTLGEGATDLGYPSVEVLVSQMIQSEGLQMHGIVAEIKKKGVAEALRTKDFVTFATAYNGDKTGAYASAMQQDYHFFMIKGSPDLTVRSAQLYLSYLGYLAHPVDGVLGDWTRQNLQKFQVSADLSPSGQVDPPTSLALEKQVFG